MRLLLLALFLSSCSHGQLMRCSEPAPEDVWHCPKEAEAPYFFCKKRDDVLKCKQPD